MEALIFRQYEGSLGKLVSSISVLLPIYVICFLFDVFDIFGVWVEREVFLASFVALILGLTFLVVPGKKGVPKDKLPPYDALLAILGLAGAGYMSLFFNEVRWREGAPTTTDIIFGIMTLVLLLEAVRRLVGWAFLIVVIAFLLYARFNFLLPGLLEGRGYDVPRLVGTLYIQKQGIFGLPTNIAATIIIIFILFGQFLVASGAGDWFVDLARCLGGRFRGGPAKVAVIASAFLGTITGSPAANVATTGVFSIPLMKKTGYQSHFAAAVESVASTGGAILPPVMGATAFVMAEFLDIPYSTVAISAFVPAALYFLALFMQVDLEAAKRGLRGLPREEIPSLRETIKRGWHYLIPLAVLVYFLLIRGYSPAMSGLYACLAVILVSQLSKETRVGPRKILQSLEGTSYGTLLIAVTCAAAGIIIGVVALTGLGVKLSLLLVDASKGSMLLLLVLTGMTSTVIGMGIPVLPAYVTLVVLIAPALASLGVWPLAAHLFIYYFAVMSFITPPVCPAVYVACGLADSAIMRTGFQAVKLGIVAYIVPFVFMYGPAMLLRGSVVDIMVSILTATIGVVSLCFGIAGYALMRANWLQRAMLLAGGIILIAPGWKSDMVGAAVVMGAILWQGISSIYPGSRSTRES